MNTPFSAPYFRDKLIKFITDLSYITQTNLPVDNNYVTKIKTDFNH